MGFLAVGMDPSEGPEVLRAYQRANSYPWPAAVGNREILEAYKVTTTATKFALDTHGIITFQKGYGVGSQGEWSQLLRSLAAP